MSANNTVTPKVVAAAAAETITPSMSSSTPSMSSSSVKSTPLRFSVDTLFDRDTNQTICIRPKNQKKYGIFFPAPLMGKRCSIVFSATPPQGLHPSFAKFLQKEMAAVVSKWRRISDAIKWFEKKKNWKDTLVAAWKTQSSRKRKRLFVPAQDSPVVNLARKNTTLTVPVPVFSDTPIDLTVDQEGSHGIGIHITCRENKTSKNAPQAYMHIPKTLSGKKRGLDFTLGATFGINKMWVQYAVSYLRYAVGKWKSHADAQTWCKHLRSGWKKHVNALYRYRGGNANLTTQFWRIDKSGIKPDEGYIKNRWFPAPSDSVGTGSGLFCTIKGEHEIHICADYDPVKFQEGTRKIPTADLVEPQQDYAMADPTQEWQFTPTRTAIAVGCVDIGFIVQHRKTNPTHKLCWEETHKHPCLKPVRDAEVGEEFCYDYRYQNSREVPVTTRLDTLVDVVASNAPTEPPTPTVTVTSDDVTNHQV